MLLSNIKLSQFKNLQSTELTASPGFNFIIGPNGTGKTNLLDAIYYCSMTKSYFAQTDKQLLHFDSDFFRIEATFKDQFSSFAQIIKCKPPQLKSFSWDDQIYAKATDHIGTIPIVMIAPDDIYTFIHASEERRKFLNQTLVQIYPEYIDHLFLYNKLLKQRNAALKQMKQDKKINHFLLDVYDDQMENSMNYIYQKRKELIEQLSSLVFKYSNKISQNIQNSTITYHSQVNSSLRDIIKQNREKDFFTQRTNVGIHKDAVSCLMNDRPIREYGSQGQIKTFIMALRMAQYHYLYVLKKIKPILLLDDVFAKFDKERVKALIQLIANEGIDQCIIADTQYEQAQTIEKELTIQTSFHLMDNGKIYNP